MRLLSVISYAFISFSIQAIRRLTIFSCCAFVSSLFLGTLYHLFRQPRQQQAQACCALNTGCPFIGVCLPSLGIYAGARRLRIKSSAWERIVSIPLFLTYSLSFKWKPDLNFDLFNFSKALSIVCKSFAYQSVSCLSLL